MAESIFGAYPRFRQSMTRQLAQRPSEARILAYGMGVCLLLFMGRLPALLFAPPGTLTGGLLGNVAATMVTLLFFMPLFLYGIAALARMIARRFGGTGDWYETRLATFWGLLVAAPVQLSAALIANTLTLAGLEGAAQALSGAAALIAGWIWASCLAEAHGFRRTGVVFATMAAVILAVTLLAFALTRAPGA